MKVCLNCMHSGAWKRYVFKSFAGFGFAGKSGADSKIEIALSELEIYEPVKGQELWSGETVSIENVISIHLKKHGAKVYYVK